MEKKGAEAFKRSTKASSIFSCSSHLFILFCAGVYMPMLLWFLSFILLFQEESMHLIVRLASVLFSHFPSYCVLVPPHIYLLFLQSKVQAQINSTSDDFRDICWL